METTTVDEREFTSFLSNHERLIRAYVASLGVPWDSVDEVAHEAFVQFHLGDTRRPAEVEPLRWLKSVARNCAMSWFRARTKAKRWLELSEVLETAAQRAEQQGHDDDSCSPASVSALKVCLASLPEAGRQVLDWYYRDERQAEDIAASLQQTASGVRMKLMRLRDLLGDCVRRRLRLADG
ncbi:MAG: sigma-70 family RNA polymerase sigma factor [Planctomycetes bacterium]|nr:sigma-70 family RNA polymerase sigma factor [Planctomycetota bacterium]